MNKLICYVFAILLLVAFVNAGVLEITPKSVEVGGIVNIKLNPITEMSKYIYFYSSDNEYKSKVIMDCGDRCSTSVNRNYVLPSEWGAGNYYARVFDYNSNSYVIDNFAITGSAPQNNTCVENWQCNEWSNCVNGIMTRVCLDINLCGTEENKPNEEEECTVANRYCEDSDGGINIYERGTVTYSDGDIVMKESDFCDWAYYVHEYYCDDDTVLGSSRLCESGLCVDGACVEESEICNNDSECVYPETEWNCPSDCPCTHGVCSAEEDTCNACERTKLFMINYDIGDLKWKKSSFSESSYIGGGYRASSYEAEYRYGDNVGSNVIVFDFSDNPTDMKKLIRYLTSEDNFDFFDFDAVEINGQLVYYFGYYDSGYSDDSFNLWLWYNGNYLIGVVVQEYSNYVIETTPNEYTVEKTGKGKGAQAVDMVISGQVIKEDSSFLSGMVSYNPPDYANDLIEAYLKEYPSELSGNPEKCTEFCMEAGYIYGECNDECVGNSVDVGETIDCYSKETCCCVGVVSQCNGCSDNGVCLPFGTRKMIENGAGYCDLNSKFSLQKTDGADCQNNYECISNSCSGGECINLQKEIRESASTIKKIWCWITNPFDDDGYNNCLNPSLSNGGGGSPIFKKDNVAQQN